MTTAEDTSALIDTYRPEDETESLMEQWESRGFCDRGNGRPYSNPYCRFKQTTAHRAYDRGWDNAEHMMNGAKWTYMAC